MDNDTAQTPFQKATEEVRAKNPGTELWFGELPNTGDRWIYRPPTEPEYRIFLKLSREQAGKGDAADYGIPNDVLVSACVLWPAGPDLAKLLAMRPGLRKVMAQQVAEAGGAVETVVAKKL